MSDPGKKGKRLRYNPNNEIGQFGCWKKRQKPNQHLLFERTRIDGLVLDRAKCRWQIITDPDNKVPNTRKKVNNLKDFFA